MVDSVSDQPALGPEAEQSVSEDHIALIYETAEEELSALTQLIRVGLEKGELCLYISNDGKDQVVVEALKAEHVDVDKAVSNGSLILANKSEVYFKMGRFDPDWTLRVVGNIADLAKDYGFTAMRIISDMSWALENLPGVERWAEYEAKLNSLDPGISVRAICQYDRRAFPPEALLTAVKAHPKVASHGSVCKNHLCIPAEVLLKGGYAGAELDRVLDSIRRSSSWEADLKDRQLEMEQTKKRLENEAATKKKLEAALDESRRRFAEFAERTSDWVWEIGKDGAYVYSSPRVKDILGLRPEEVLGKNILDMVSPGDAERVSDALAKAVEDHAPITALEKEVRHKDGHTVFLEMSGNPLFDRNGEFSGYRGMDRDITGRKAAKQAIDEHRKRAEISESEAEARGRRICLLETDQAQLRAAMEERDAALVSLNEALATSQHELSQAKGDVERLNSSLTERDEELSAARRAIAEKDASLSEKDGAAAAMQEALQAKDAELGTVREALAGTQDAVAQKQADIIQLRQQAEHMESELGIARTIIAQKEESLAAVQERLDQGNAEMASLRGELASAQAAVEGTRSELEARIGELQEVREILSQRDEELSATYARIGVLDVDITKASTDLSAALAAVESIRTELTSRTAELEARIGELRGARTDLSEREEALSQANARIAELEGELGRTHAELSAAVALAEGTKADLAARTAELQEVQEAQASLEGERGRLVQLVREEGDLIGSMKETVAKYSAELNERESLITNLQAAAAFRESELITRKAVAEKSASEAGDRAKEADGLRTELRAAEAELTDLRAQLAEAQEANAGKGASIAALSTKLEEIETEIRAAKASMYAKAAELARDREALDESNGRFRAIFDQAGVAVVRTDLEGKVVEANGKFFELLDRSPEEIIGSTYHSYTHRDDMIFIAGMYDQLVSGRARSGTLLARFHRRLGTVVQVSISMSVVRDERGSPRYIMSLIEDRTEQMLAERALLENERESEEAKAAAGPMPLADEHQEIIANDLNDTLTVILGSVSLAKEYVIPEGRMYNKLKQIESASVAARNLASRLMTSQPAEPAGPDTAAPDLVRGKGKILLMDDDESVLEAIGDLLTYLGYNVEVARDGREALAVCRDAREGGQPFDLAILDLAVTSGMGGREAARTMQEENPGLKLAVSGGFLTDPAMADPASFGFDMAIAKPYSAELLSKKVGELIART